MSKNHVAAARANRPMSDPVVFTIRALADGGRSLSSLARLHGVHIHTIRNIVYGRTYRDYGGPIRDPRS
jgi:hypothetical protein